MTGFFLGRNLLLNIEVLVVLGKSGDVAVRTKEKQ